MPKSTKFNRLIVAGIAAAAIAPTAAVAQQDMRAPDQVAGGAPGTGVMQDMRAPDQVDGSTVGSSMPGPPQWAANPRPIPNRHVATTSTPSTHGDGIDDGVLIALGGGALLLVGGLGVASRKRLQVVRQRQLA
jgi:hypothetical protein